MANTVLACPRMHDRSVLRTCASLLMTLTVLAGCGASDDGATATLAARLVTPGPGTVTVSVPALVQLESAVVVSSEAVDLGDRFIIQGPGDGAVVAMGGTGALIRNDSRVMDVFGRTSIQLLDRVIVSGSLFTSGTVSVPSSSSVTGLTVTDYLFDPPEQFSWTYDAPTTSGGAVSLEPNQTASIAPGRYGHVSVKSGAKLAMSSGEYHFDDLDALEPQAQLVIDGAAGPVLLYIHGVLRYRGAFTSATAGEEPNIVAVVLDTQTVYVESPFHGFLVAPNALVQLRSTPTPHVGAFFAKHVVTADAGVTVNHRPFDRATLFPDLWPPEPPEPPEPPPPDDYIEAPWDGNIPVMAPGQTDDPIVVTDGCAPGLLLVSTRTGVDIDTHLAFNEPEPGGCIDEYTECTELSPETGEESAPRYLSFEELNALASPDDVCPGQPTRYPCGIIEESIEWDDDFGLCTKDADCLLYGKVCAAVCVEEGCTGSPACLEATCAMPQGRCAEIEPGCEPMPTEAGCKSVRQCADEGAIGTSSDPAERADSDLEEVADPSSVVIPPASPIELPVTYANDVDGCANPNPLPQIDINPDNQDRDINSGNSSWGIQVHPTMTYQANVKPQRIGGEAIVDVRAEAGLKVDATVFDNTRTVFEASGRAVFTTCRVNVGRLLRIFGKDFPAGPGDPVLEGEECNDKLTGQDGDFLTLKKAQVDAIATRKYALCIGAPDSSNEALWAKLCDDVNQALENWDIFYDVPPGLTCATPSDAPAVVQTFYAYYRDKIAQRLETIDANSAAALGQDYPIVLPFLDQRHNYMGEPIIIPFPIGPVQLMIEIEFGGSWGIDGEVRAELADNPDAKIHGKAVVRPAAGVVAVAFAGVGLGPVRVGIAGELLLVDAGIPIHADIDVTQSSSPDERDATSFRADYPSDAAYAFASAGPTVPPSFRPFGPRYSEWSVKWAYGAGARVTVLSGKIDVQARVNLLFTKKTFSKKLAQWPGFSGDYVFFGTALGEDADGKPAVTPLGGEPDYGVAHELVPYIEPNAISTHDFGQAPGSPACAPPGLGPCAPLT